VAFILLVNRRSLYKCLQATSIVYKRASSYTLAIQDRAILQALRVFLESEATKLTSRARG
jgi:hypothetical protein